MRYDFDTFPDRKKTNSVKWDVSPGELPMSLADMDFITAPCITEAVINRAEKGAFGYTDVPDEWYNSIISWWSRRHGLEMKRSELIFCTGVVPAISCLVKRFTNIGDRVLVLTPVYDIFYHSIENAGRITLESPMRRVKNGYEIDFADLEEKLARPLTTLMILCNPHNPSGTLWTEKQLEKIGKLCFKHHVTVISDEIHCDIVEPCKKYVPFASVCPECASNSVTCISASKAFSIAGLQSAAVFVPDERLRNIAVRGLNSDEVAEPNCFAAVATAAAFDKGEQWLDELNAYIAENKRFAREFITKNVSPVVLFDQPATYLMWLDCRDLCSDTDELCEFLRENTGLILSPGKKYRGDGRLYLRMNVACPRDKLLDGLKRFEKGVRSFSESKSKN